MPMSSTIVRNIKFFQYLSNASTASGFIINGTLARITEVMANLTFTPDPHSFGIVRRDIVLIDNGNFGSGPSLTYTGHIAIQVKQVNDPPFYTSLPAPLPDVEMRPCPEYDILAFCPVIAILDEDSSITISPGFSIDNYDPYRK